MRNKYRRRSFTNVTSEAKAGDMPQLGAMKHMTLIHWGQNTHGQVSWSHWKDVWTGNSSMGHNLRLRKDRVSIAIWLSLGTVSPLGNNLGWDLYPQRSHSLARGSGCCLSEGSWVRHNKISQISHTITCLWTELLNMKAEKNASHIKNLLRISIKA